MTELPAHRNFDCIAFQRQRRAELAHATQHLSNRGFHAWVSGLAAHSQELWDQITQVEQGISPEARSAAEEKRRDDGSSASRP